MWQPRGAGRLAPTATTDERAEMTDSWDAERERAEESEEENLLGHDPVRGPSDEEADVHGDNLTRVDEDLLGDDDAAA